MLDDPEMALHPHLMGRRVEFLRDVAQGSFTGNPIRVVVATQSADFVRWLELSEVRIVEFAEGAGTRVRSVQHTETLDALLEKFDSNTGDLWYSGALGGLPGARE